MTYDSKKKTDTACRCGGPGGRPGMPPICPACARAALYGREVFLRRLIGYIDLVKGLS